MPLSAKFEADFESFYAAVAKANLSLNSFEQETADVETRLNRMANAFSGVKVIQDATAMAAAIEKLGGVSGLTEKELAKVGRTAGEAVAKLQAMGQQVPKGIQDLATAAEKAAPPVGLLGQSMTAFAYQMAGMVSVGSIVALVGQTLDMADATKDLAGQLGITTDEVQGFQAIARETGAPITAMTSAIQYLEKQLGTEDAGTIAALKKLGINVDELRKMRGAEQLYTVADALGTMDDRSQAAALGAETLGKSYKDLTGAITAGMRQIADEAPKMSAAAIEAADRVNKAWEGMKTGLVIGAAEIIREFDNLGRAMVAPMVGLEAAFDQTDKQLGQSVAGLIAKAEQVRDSFGGALAKAPLDLKKNWDDYEAILKKSDEALKPAIAANEKFAAALTELNSVGGNWQQTLSTMNGDMVEAVKYYLQAGVSQSALQQAYGLTAAQIGAVTDALRAEAQAAQQAAEAGRLAGTLFREAEQTRIEASGTATDIAMADINRWFHEVETRAREAGLATTQFYDALGQAYEAKLAPILADTRAVAETSAEYYKQTLEENAQRAEATYQAILSSGRTYSVKTINQFYEQARAAREAADTWAYSFEQAGETATAAVEKTTRAAQQGVEQLSKFAQGAVQIQTPGITISNMEEAYKQYSAQFSGWGRAGAIGGGPAEDFVSWALKHGLAFKNLPPTGGGVANTVNVNMTGMLGANDPQTKQALTTAVNEALASAMRQQRLFTSA
jgi:hypothetical protein